MGLAHPSLIGNSHQPQSVDYALPFLYGNTIIKMGFIELITEHIVGPGPLLSRLSRHSRGPLVCIICNDDITPQLCDSCSLVGSETAHFSRNFCHILMIHNVISGELSAAA